MAKKLWIGITDFDWFRFHSSKAKIDEVNFWSPSSNVGFRALPLGGPFLFKLKSPRNYIAGGGFFVRYEKLSIGAAWDNLGAANGASSLPELRYLIGRNRHETFPPSYDPLIGCTILSEPFFFDEKDWIPFRLKSGIQRGTTVDMESEIGRVEAAARLQRTTFKSDGPATTAAQDGPRYGPPRFVAPRLGQGSFRVLVTSAYQRRCAMTGERTLPALEAAHIHRFSAGGEHQVSNGLLLRSDLHRLFDRGYITVDPNNFTILVSKRIKEEYENGRDYYALKDKRLSVPSDSSAMPAVEYLRQHNESFRG